MKKRIHVVIKKRKKESICHRISAKKAKYKMICQNSPKSSEFAICLVDSGQKSLAMFMSSCFNIYSIKI